MKRWLLLALLPIALVLVALGALVVRESRGAEAGSAPSDSAVCPAGAQGDSDRSALIASLDAAPLSDMPSAELSEKCYLVGIDRFINGCGSEDLYVLRYLCYNPAGRDCWGSSPCHWHYVNYWYCQCETDYNGGNLDPGGWTSMYSFSGTCSAANYIDPVSVVFYDGTADEVEDHAADHGEWTYHCGGSQNMFSYGYCYGIDGHSNSELDEGAIQGEQYHMRLWEARDFGGSTGSCAWTPYVLATPHKEAWTQPQPGCGSSWHSVYPTDESGAGGFVEGRDDIYDNWVDHGPHRYVGKYWWGNTQRFKQSAGYGIFSGCWYARSDGYVEYISLDHRS